MLNVTENKLIFIILIIFQDSSTIKPVCALSFIVTFLVLSISGFVYVICCQFHLFLNFLKVVLRYI